MTISKTNSTRCWRHQNQAGTDILNGQCNKRNMTQKSKDTQKIVKVVFQKLIKIS